MGDQVDGGADDGCAARVRETDDEANLALRNVAVEVVGGLGLADHDLERALDDGGQGDRVDLRQDAARIERQCLVQPSPDPVAVDPGDLDLGGLGAGGGEVVSSAAGEPAGAVDALGLQPLALGDLALEAAPQLAVPVLPDHVEGGAAGLGQVQVDVEGDLAGEGQQRLVAEVEDVGDVLEVGSVEDTEALSRRMPGAVIDVLIATRPEAPNLDQPGRAEADDVLGLVDDLIARLGRWRRRHLRAGGQGHRRGIVPELEDHRSPSGLRRGALDPQHGEKGELVLVRRLVQPLEEGLQEAGMGLDQRGIGAPVGGQPGVDETGAAGEQRADDVGPTAIVEKLRRRLPHGAAP